MANGLAQGTGKPGQLCLQGAGSYCSHTDRAAVNVMRKHPGRELCCGHAGQLLTPGGRASERGAAVNTGLRIWVTYLLPVHPFNRRPSGVAESRVHPCPDRRPQNQSRKATVGLAGTTGCIQVLKRKTRSSSLPSPEAGEQTQALSVRTPGNQGLEDNRGRWLSLPSKVSTDELA